MPLIVRRGKSNWACLRHLDSLFRTNATPVGFSSRSGKVYSSRQGDHGID